MEAFLLMTLQREQRDLCVSHDLSWNISLELFYGSASFETSNVCLLMNQSDFCDQNTRSRFYGMNGSTHIAHCTVYIAF